MSITIEELNKLDKDTYQIIDIRDKEEVQKDEMSGAVYVPSDEIETSGKVDLSKKLIICCRIGKISIDVAEQLREKGIDAVSLEGGYTAWLLDSIKRKEAESISRDVEQSIRKKFRKKIWSTTSTMMPLCPNFVTNSLKRATRLRSVYRAEKTQCLWQNFFRNLNFTINLNLK
jgi:rhodanese-related sulfurtransferase